MTEFISMFRDDWLRIPTSYRYIFFAGAGLIGLAWIGDHWSDNQQYILFPFLSNETVFQLGSWLIVIFFLALLFNQVTSYRNIRRVRQQFPVNELGRQLHLVNFQGIVYLFDDRHQMRFHIKNQQTAIDLNFLNEWEYVNLPPNSPDDTELTLTNGHKIRIGDYTFNPAGIHTRGITAT